MRKTVSCNLHVPLLIIQCFGKYSVKTPKFQSNIFRSIYPVSAKAVCHYNPSSIAKLMW